MAAIDSALAHSPTHEAKKFNRRSLQHPQSSWIDRNSFGGNVVSLPFA
jgi:hypothetical protein